MNRDAHPAFGVPAGLPLDDLRPGTNVMVSGPSGRGARAVALRLVMAGVPDEGVLLLSADLGGRSLLERAETVVGDVDRGRVAVVDSSGIDDEQRRFEEYGDPIDDPGDLLQIEMEFSRLYETLVERGYDRVRLGVFSVSSLLAHADLQDVSRFVHMLTGRVIATDDLGVFVVDSTMQDERTVDAIEQYCDGKIDVRDAASGSGAGERDEGDEGEFEVRVRGCDAPSENWTTFAPGEADQRRRRS